MKTHFLSFPLQSAVEEEEEEEEKPSTIPEKEAEKPADPPEQINPENNLPSTEVKRSAGLFLQSYLTSTVQFSIWFLLMSCFRGGRCDFLFNVDLIDHCEAAEKGATAAARMIRKGGGRIQLIPYWLCLEVHLFKWWDIRRSEFLLCSDHKHPFTCIQVWFTANGNILIKWLQMHNLNWGSWMQHFVFWKFWVFVSLVW